MSNELPSARTSIMKRVNVTVVAATYNEKFTTPLLNNCVEELEEALPLAKITVVRVPGSYEVPVMVKRAIELGGDRPDVVVGLGLIIRGSTAHADLIGAAITNNLMSIACETMVPVIHEVLLLDTEEQAFARCIASKLNRGREAARAAAAMIEAMDELDAGRSQMVLDARARHKDSDPLS